MLFQRNAWYIVARLQDIDRELKRRVILNEPVLLYRTEQGEPVAIQDRCPHRFAPLSRGTLFGDVVECKYHGLRFDQTGACVLNPQGDVIAPNSQVRSYPIEERHGLVWIWMGDPALARNRKIPDLSYGEGPTVRTVHGYMRADYRYDILVDNLLDLSHADYLHVGSFMGGVCGRSETTVREENDEVTIVFTQWDAPAPPSRPDLGKIVDHSFRIHWRPGQVISFEYRGVPAGGDLSTSPVFRFAHIPTPETEGSTHYFMSITRDFALDDAEMDARMLSDMMGVIEREDSPMLEAVDAQMAGKDLMEMRPVILPADKGALHVRRVMKRLIDQERAAMPPVADSTSGKLVDSPARTSGTAHCPV